MRDSAQCADVNHPISGPLVLASVCVCLCMCVPCWSLLLVRMLSVAQPLVRMLPVA